MVVLTTHQLLLVAFFGGLFAAVLTRGLVLAWKAAHWLARQLLDRMEQRRALRSARRRLRTFTTIDDLKE